MQTEATM